MRLKLENPLSSILITQKFGDNATPVYGQQGLIGHNGIDYRAPHGTPVLAAHDGTAYYQIDGNGGHGVVIITDKQYDYGGEQAYFKTIYWHLVDPLKDIKFRSPLLDFPWGKPVKAGEIIGYADNTGLSTGSHLHFGLKPVAKVGESNNSWANIEQTNGYYGAIDPAPYLLPEFPYLTDLQKGISHPDVLRLQKFLNARGFTVALFGLGSPGKETNYFGALTFQAVKGFQDAFKIANPGDPGYGRVGPRTRAKINSLINQ